MPALNKTRIATPNSTIEVTNRMARPDADIGTDRLKSAGSGKSVWSGEPPSAWGPAAMTEERQKSEMEAARHVPR
jgi:hypothetical protein